MLTALLLLLIVLALFGAGFAMHLVWIAAAVLLAVWLIGFVVRSGERAAWYRW